MTVIVWDGKTLAADKLCVVGTVKLTVTKIRTYYLEGSEFLVGVCGDFDLAQEFFNWFGSIREIGIIDRYLIDRYESFPSCLRDKDVPVSALVIRGDHQVFKYERSPLPMEYGKGQFAIGSGKEFAIGAMQMGANSFQAVQIANRFDYGCGNGIDELSFE